MITSNTKLIRSTEREFVALFKSVYSNMWRMVSDGAVKGRSLAGR